MTPPEVIALEGPPGSGKTTLAAKLVTQGIARGERWARLCRDDMRDMFHGGYQDQPWQEDQVTVATDAMLRALLTHGVSVIVDATHLQSEHRLHLDQVAAECGVQQVQWINLTGSAPLEECIRRDAARPPRRRVGETRIRQMMERAT